MTTRRLVDGIKSSSTSKDVEENFVYQKNSEPDDKEKNQPNRPLPQISARVPVTTRCRLELATKLKQASLQRQLTGQRPYFVQDIMEEALQHWLTEHGYL